MKRLALFQLLGLCSLIINVVLHSQIASADEVSANRTSMFNEQWLDTVVSVEQLASHKQPDGTTKMVSAPIGTGFIVETKNKHLVLITARHVVTDDADSKLLTKKNLLYRINQQEGPAYLLEDRQLEENGRGNWFLSTTHDLACRFLEWKTTSKFRAITQDKFLPKIKLQTGANLLVLGFPLGLRSEEHPNPIARKGMVARADRDDLLADAFVFPGNSGGPVLYEPPIKIMGNGLITSPFINDEHLIGLVASYIPYPEVAVSSQSKRPRVIFEENSGLTNVVPVDAIIELLNHDDVTQLDSLN
jgi:trypsin-like peptidase